MTKIIGYTGSHRTGKTTLAKAIAEKNEWLFVPTSMTSIWEKIGFDPSKPVTMEERIKAQMIALDEIEELYRGLPKDEVVVLDRTPVDMAAYTLAEAIPGNITEEQSELVRQYVVKCAELTNKHFGLLLIVQPGIEVVDAPGKAMPNLAYMDHLNMICFGLLAGEMFSVPHYYLPRKMTDLNERIKASTAAYNRSIHNEVQRWMATGATSTFH